MEERKVEDEEGIKGGKRPKTERMESDVSQYNL